MIHSENQVNLYGCFVFKRLLPCWRIKFIQYLLWEVVDPRAVGNHPFLRLYWKQKSGFRSEPVYAPVGTPFQEQGKKLEKVKFSWWKKKLHGRSLNFPILIHSNPLVINTSESSQCELTTLCVGSGGCGRGREQNKWWMKIHMLHSGNRNCSSGRRRKCRLVSPGAFLLLRSGVVTSWTELMLCSHRNEIE